MCTFLFVDSCLLRIPTSGVKCTTAAIVLLFHGACKLSNKLSGLEITVVVITPHRRAKREENEERRSKSARDGGVRKTRE